MPIKAFLPICFLMYNLSSRVEKSRYFKISYEVQYFNFFFDVIKLYVPVTNRNRFQ